MPANEIVISGTVPGARQAVRDSMGAIRALAKDIALSMRRKQELAFLYGGHAHRGGSDWVDVQRETYQRGTIAPLVRTGRASRQVRAKLTIKPHAYGTAFVLRLWNSAREPRNGVLYMGMHQHGFKARNGMRVTPRPSLQFTMQDASALKNAFRSVILPGGGGASGRKKRK